MQLTTREALDMALRSMNHVFFETNMVRKDQDAMLCAARLLCETYGFKLTDYFEGVE